MKIDNQGDWGRTTYGERRLCADRSGTETTPQQAKSHQVYTDALLANLRKGKNVVEGGAIAVKNKVIVKDRDEWSSLADFIGNMIAKYADEIDFDSLPDPDIYFQKRYIYEPYKAYMKFRNKKTK